MSWKTELIHAAGSTTVPEVLLQESYSCDWLSTGQFSSFIYNKKRRANRKTCSQTANAEKDQLCRLQGQIIRGTIESYNSETVSKLWYLDRGGNLPLQLLGNYSYFFGLCPDTFLLPSLCLPTPLWSTCFVLHLLPALILVLLSLAFNSLFFTFMFLLLLIFFVALVTLPILLHPRRLGDGVFDTPGLWYPRRLWQGLLARSQRREAWADGQLLELVVISIWASTPGWATIPVTIQKEHEYCARTNLYLHMQWHQE